MKNLRLKSATKKQISKTQVKERCFKLLHEEKIEKDIEVEGEKVKAPVSFSIEGEAKFLPVIEENK